MLAHDRRTDGTDAGLPFVGARRPAAGGNELDIAPEALEVPGLAEVTLGVGSVREEHLGGRSREQRKGGADGNDRAKLIRRLHGVDAHALVAGPDEELRRLPRHAHEVLQHRVRDVAKRQLSRSAIREPQQTGSQPVPVSAVVREEPLVLERSDQSMSRGAGKAGGVRDRAEPMGASLDRPKDRRGPVQHAHPGSGRASAL